jgi:hypothetical protein
MEAPPRSASIVQQYNRLLRSYKLGNATTLN